MMQAGLNVDQPDEDDDEDQNLGDDLRVALLEMLTLALGIRSPRDVALGPLLTAQPPHS